MAAATVTQRKINRTASAARVVTAGSVVFANNGDTWTVPGIKQIYSINLTPTTGTAFGFTRSGNVLTLAAAGGLTFSGSVTGI